MVNKKDAFLMKFKQWYAVRPIFAKNQRFMIRFSYIENGFIGYLSGTLKITILFLVCFL